MELKPSNFIIALILIVGIFSVLFDFTSKLLNNYDVAIPQQHNATFQKLKDRTDLEDITEETKSSVMNEDEAPTTIADNDQDILGKFFGRGVKTIMKVPKTIDIFYSMVNSLLNSNVNLLGTATVSIKFIIMSIVIITLMFYFVSAKLRWGS